MNTSFSHQQGLIIVPVEVDGPAKTVFLQMAIDTGSTNTVVGGLALVEAGYEPALSPSRLQITTGSGVEQVPQVIVTTLRALGQERINLPALAHTLPSSAIVDGLLGLDFFRGQTLTIDFRNGLITLS